MKFEPTILSGAYLVTAIPVVDERGWFARSFCKQEFSSIQHSKEWLQMNFSFTKNKGSIRGMHFQKPPYSEIKLVACITGSVFDVMIDLREDSPTYLKWFGAVLSADNHQMMYIPEGFAHGFQTLEDDTTLLYHHSAYYQAGFEGGIRFDDPAIGIEWKLPPTVISQRDQTYSFIDSSFEGIKIPA